MSFLTKYLDGNIDCSCCFPPKGHRKAEFRTAKRRESSESEKETKQELQDWWDSSHPEEPEAN